MILLDADVLLIDVRYANDPRYAINRQALDRVRTSVLAVGATAHTLLATVGILSFNVSPARVPRLAQHLCIPYRLAVFPELTGDSGYAGCTVNDLIAQMSRQMALGDAVQAVQIQLHASGADCLLTWNAKHFVGKLVIPVLTPQEWLDQQASVRP